MPWSAATGPNCGRGPPSSSGWAIVQAVAGVMRHRRAVTELPHRRRPGPATGGAPGQCPGRRPDPPRGRRRGGQHRDHRRPADRPPPRRQRPGHRRRGVLRHRGRPAVLLVGAPRAGSGDRRAASSPSSFCPSCGRSSGGRRPSARRGPAASSLAADTVVGLRVLRGLGGEEVFADRYAEASQEVRVGHRPHGADPVHPRLAPGLRARRHPRGRHLHRRPSGAVRLHLARAAGGLLRLRRLPDPARPDPDRGGHPVVGGHGGGRPGPHRAAPAYPICRARRRRRPSRRSVLSPTR